MSAQLLAFSAAANSNQAEGSGDAASLFGEYMLMELVLEVARSSQDPQGRLAELFDRITTRARRGGVVTEKNSTMTQFRKHAETFFIMAGKNV